MLTLVNNSFGLLQRCTYQIFSFLNMCIFSDSLWCSTDLVFSMPIPHLLLKEKCRPFKKVFIEFVTILAILCFDFLATRHVRP